MSVLFEAAQLETRQMLKALEASYAVRQHGPAQFSVGVWTVDQRVKELVEINVGPDGMVAVEDSTGALARACGISQDEWWNGPEVMESCKAADVVAATLRVLWAADRLGRLRRP